MPPTPLQNSYSSFEEEQGHFEMEEQIWSARDRTVIARMKQYPEESKSLMVEVAEVTFSRDGPSEFLVVSCTLWDKHQRRLNAPWRQNSSASSSGRQWQEGLEE